MLLQKSRCPTQICGTCNMITLGKKKISLQAFRPDLTPYLPGREFFSIPRCETPGWVPCATAPRPDFGIFAAGPGRLISAFGLPVGPGRRLTEIFDLLTDTAAEAAPAVSTWMLVFLLPEFGQCCDGTTFGRCKVAGTANETERCTCCWVVAGAGICLVLKLPAVFCFCGALGGWDGIAPNVLCLWIPAVQKKKVELTILQSIGKSYKCHV